MTSVCVQNLQCLPFFCARQYASDCEEGTDRHDVSYELTTFLGNDLIENTRASHYRLACMNNLKKMDRQVQ